MKEVLFVDDARAMSELIERIVHADKVGLDVFGIGEHHQGRVFRFRST